jgi:hypothetical protein
LIALCLAVISTSAAITGQDRMQQVTLDNLGPYTDSHMRRRLATDCQGPNQVSVVPPFSCSDEDDDPCAGTSSCCVYSGTCANANTNNCP